LRELQEDDSVEQPDESTARELPPGVLGRVRARARARARARVRVRVRGWGEG
jgi:hypothetical protein